MNFENRSKISLAFLFLVSIASAFSAELDGLISRKDIGLKPHTVYVRKNATDASSKFSVITENTTKTNGVSTISKTSLPKNEGVVFDRIAVGFAEHANAGMEGQVDYSSTKLPAVLRNANLVISQNNREVVNVPIADLGKVTSPTSQEDYYHDLESFQYLADDSPMQWEIVFPDGTSLAPGTVGYSTYVEIRIKGFKTSRKS